MRQKSLTSLISPISLISRINRILKFSRIFQSKKSLALMLIFPLLVFGVVLFLRLKIKNETQATPLLSVEVTSPDTHPELFKIKNEKGELVPYLLEHKSKEGIKEVTMRAKSGVQKFIFSRKSPTVEILYKKDGENFFKKILETNLTVEYNENGTWKPLNNITENALTSKELKDSVDILTFYRVEANGKAGYLDNEVNLGLVNKKYIRKWTFKFKPDDEKTLYRLVWKVKTDNNFPFENIDLDTSDFKGSQTLKNSKNSKTFIFYPDGINGSFEVDPTLSVSTNSTTISVTSNQNPSWKAVWNEGKGGLIDEFYTPSNSTTNIVNNSGSQINQDLCNLRMAVSSGTNDSVAAADSYPKLHLIESSSTRVKIRTEGDLIVSGDTTDNGDYIQDYVIYPDKIICSGLVAWNNATSATIFEHSFNFKPIFTNNQTSTSIWLGDNDTSMTEFTTGTTWRTATGITYDAPGPVAVLQLTDSPTNITIWTIESPFQVAESNRFYWERSLTINKFAWGGDNLTFARGETFGFGSIIKIANDATTDGSEGRKYAQDFWNNSGVDILQGSGWDSQDEGKGRFSRLNDFHPDFLGNYFLLSYPTFSDDFESGNTSYWSNEVDTGGNFNINSQSKKDGNYGAQVNITNQEAYVQKHIRSCDQGLNCGFSFFSQPLRLRVRFYLNPNNITMASGDTFTILSDNTVDETPFYFLQLNYDGTNYRVRAGMQQDGTGTNGCGFLDRCTSFVDINRNSFNLIEIEWGIIDTKGYIKLWVNNKFATKEIGVDAGDNFIDGILFGYIAGRDAGTSGSIYLDNFKFTLGRLLGGSEFNNFESAFTASASSEVKAGFRIDAASFNRFNPVFKVSNWNKNTKSFNGIKFDGKEIVDGVDFNAKNTPVAKSYFASNIVWESTLDSAIAATSSASIGSPGTLVNPDSSIRFGKGRYGGAMYVTSFTHRVEVPVNGNFDIQSGALECWFKPNYNSTNNNFSYICAQLLNSAGNGYELAVAKDDSSGPSCNGNSNCLSFYSWINGSLQASVYFTSSQYSWSAEGEWHHILAIWDASLNSTDDLQLYLDGEKAPNRFGAVGAYDPSTFPLPTNFQIASYFALTDEVRIYDFSNGGSPFSTLTDNRETTTDEEYLGSESNNFTLSFNAVDSSNRGSYIFFGADEKFTGLIVDLATKGSGSNLNINWEYWAGKACNNSLDNCWVSLENVQGFSDTTNNFTKDGIVSWAFAPPNWQPYSVAGSPDLYFVRAHLQSGSYTTSPVERTIVTNVAIIQYFGTLTKNNHILEIPGKSRLLNLHLDEGSGTTSKDNSPFANNFTISGARWNASGGINSRTNRAIYLTFDGVNDYLSRSTDYDFNFAQTSFSITGWFRHPSTISGTDTILSNATSVSGVGYKVYMNSSGNICFGINSESGSFPSDSACSTNSYTDSAWHHFAAVKSGVSSITLYIDGIQVAQDNSLTSSGNLNTDATIYIGIDADQTSNPWQGDLDEINIHNFALSKAEVLAEIPDPTSALFGSNPTDPLTNGLIGYWKMDETSGNPADSSGNGYTLTNNGTTPFVGAKFGKGSSHTPASQQYFSTTSTISGVKTVSFWVYPDSTTNYYISLTSSAYITSSSGNLSATGFTNPKIYVNAISTTTISANTWQLVTVTTDTPIDANQFYVGRVGTNYFDGMLDEVRLYNRALTPAEIEKLYNWAPGPVAYYKFDEGAGNTARDSSSYSNVDLEVIGLWAPGKFGNSLYNVDPNGNNGASGFDLSDSPLAFSDNTNFTIMAWVDFYNFDQYNQIATIVGRTNCCGAPIYRLFVNGGFPPSKTVSFEVVDKAADGNDSYIVETTTQIPSGWVHIAATFDDSNPNNINIFFNGIPQPVTRTGNLSSINGFEQDSYIAAATLYYGLFGKIDEFKIYNYARTQAQIIEDMNAGHPAPGSPVGSYVARWKMDDLSGTTAKDSLGNYNLTLSSASWTPNGKFGGAWRGLGSNWLFILDSNTNGSLDPLSNEDFSISLWIRSSSATNPSGNEVLVEKVLTNIGYRIIFNSSGQISCQIRDAVSQINTVISTNDFYDANWHNIICLRDIGKGRLYLYIDGNLQAETNLTATGSLDSNATFVLGDSDISDNGNEFNGDIDEVKFFRLALTSEQVKLEYNQGATAQIGVLGTNPSYEKQAASQEYCIPGDSSYCAPPVGRWKLDENTGIIARDSSGNSNNAAITQGNGGYIFGKFGGAFNFDSSNSRINAGSPSILDNLPANGMSISAWVYPRSQGEGNAGFIVAKNSGTIPTFGWIFQISGTNALTFTVDGSTDLVRTTNNNAVTTNTWNHVAVSWDGEITTASSVRIYVNGTEATYATTTDGASRVDDAPSDFFIGNNSTQARTFDGLIDDVKVYNYARTPAQILWDYNRGAPFAWYKFDECTGTTVYNSALNSNGEPAGLNGIIKIGASGTNTQAGTCASGNSGHAWYNGRIGKFNSSLDFDGTDDYVETTDNDSLDFANGQDFTIEAWIKRDSFTTDDTIIAKKNDQTTGIGYILYVDDANDDLNFVVSDGTNTFSVNGRNSITSSDWYHIVAVFDENSSSGTTIYVNGVEDKESVSGNLTNVGSLSNSLNLRIGSESDSGETFDGKIDNVKIYYYALTNTQIKTSFNENSAVRFGPNTGSP